MPVDSVLLLLIFGTVALFIGLLFYFHHQKIKIALGKLRISLSDQYVWNPVIRADTQLVRPEEWLLKDSLEAFRDLFLPRLQSVLPEDLSIILEDLVIVLKPSLGVDYRFDVLRPWFSPSKFLIQIDLGLFDPLRTKEESIARAIAHNVLHLYLQKTMGNADCKHKTEIWKISHL